jgi:hypothetical protein
MSKKTLLNETQIRRFMKLADLGATHKFKSLREGDMAYDRDEDMGDMGDMGEMPPAEDEDLPPVGAPEGEGLGVELEPEAKEVVERAVDSAIEAMGKELEALGVEISSSIEGEDPVPELDPEGGPMGGAEADAAPVEPAGAEDDLALQEDKQSNKGHGPNAKAGNQARSDVANKVPAGSRWLKEVDDDDVDTLEEEGINVIDDEEIVEQVVKRVAARLMRESRSQRRNRQIDTLAEKIAKKLSKG